MPRYDESQVSAQSVGRQRVALAGRLEPAGCRCATGHDMSSTSPCSFLQTDVQNHLELCGSHDLFGPQHEVIALLVGVIEQQRRSVVLEVVRAEREANAPFLIV